MKVWEGTSFDVYFNQNGVEGPKKQIVPNIIENPSDTDVIALGQLLQKVSPEDTTYDSTVVVTKNRVIN